MYQEKNLTWLTIKKRFEDCKYRHIKGKSLVKYFKGADYVFHLAALAQVIPSIKNPKKYYKNNVIGTLNVVEAAKKVKLKN